MSYLPSKTVLQKYADVLINFALNGGKGVKKDEVVVLQIPECAKPMVNPLQIAVLKAGCYPIIQYSPEETSKVFFENANDKQLNYFPKDYMLERINTADHIVSIISTNNHYELKDIDSKKIMERSKASKFYSDAYRNKVNSKKLSWTLALFGTEHMAEEANLSLKEYWKQIIKACFLDMEDPIQKWKEVFKDLESIRAKLNKLKIDYVHVEGEDVDLKVKIGPGRQWLGGSGCNIPSFELFISPDFRGTEGWIKFNQPLYRYGNLIDQVELEFKKGKVVKAKAKKNEGLLKDMIGVDGADQVGEFSLTDRRMSRITKFMGETLFDENVGGKYGNTHIAVGSAYRESYPDQVECQKFTEKDWKNLGFNESVVHTDIVSTTNRTVTAFLEDGSCKVIYKNGEFTV
jgi:aminopeptidase